MVSESNSIIELERFLTVDEVAAYYGVTSRVTVWRWRKEGRLPKPDLERGNMRRWKVRSLIEWDKLQKERDHQARNRIGGVGKSLWKKLGLA